MASEMEEVPIHRKEEKKKKIVEEREVKEERQLYPSVQDFLKTEHKCEEKYVGSFDLLPRKIHLFGGQRIPDVYGWNEGKDILYLAEGKLNFSGSNFDICLGQGVSCQRIADFVYLFFKKDSWDVLRQEDQQVIKEECKRWKLGLLLVDPTKETKDSIQAEIKPERNERLNEDLKKDAIGLLDNFFPKFDSPYYPNEDEFKNFKLATLSGMHLLSYIKDHTEKKIFPSIRVVQFKMQNFFGEEKEWFRWYYKKQGDITYSLNFYLYGFVGVSGSNLPLLSLKFDSNLLNWSKQGKVDENEIKRLLKELILSSENEKTLISLWSWQGADEEGHWNNETGFVELVEDSIPSIVQSLVKNKLSPQITTTFNIFGQDKDDITREVYRKYKSLRDFFEIFYSL